MTYTLAIQHHSNSGFGWEPIDKTMGGVEIFEISSRDEAAKIAAARELIGTTVDVFLVDDEGAADLVANTGRGETVLHWIA